MVSTVSWTISAAGSDFEPTMSTEYRSIQVRGFPPNTDRKTLGRQVAELLQHYQCALLGYKTTLAERGIMIVTVPKDDYFKVIVPLNRSLHLMQQPDGSIQVFYSRNKMGAFCCTPIF